MMKKDDLWERAIEFATRAHSGAIRKGTNIPYVVHPIEASVIVRSLTEDLEVVAAAVLHDVIEDTSYTYEDLEGRFGKRVADLVAMESENKRPEMKASESWQVRKEEFLEHLQSAPREAKMIALGDKLSNIRSTVYTYSQIGEDCWKRFNVKDKSKQKWYYCSVANRLKEFSDTEAWRELCRHCKYLFGDLEV